MGLDMYLRKNYYVQNWEFMKPEELHHFIILKGDKPSLIPTDKICYVQTTEVYWRKANAIHKWFVDNVQNGVDECQTVEVSEDSLKELLSTINQVLADHSKAKSLLPPQEGFFFGSTKTDKYYWEDLEYTKKELERLLATPDDGGSYEYHSSW